MSHSYYVEVYFLEPTEPGPVTIDQNSLENFRACHDARLTFESKGEDFFNTLEECAQNLDLPSLNNLGLSKYDYSLESVSEGELWVRHMLPSELKDLRRDIANLIGMARSSPKSLVFEFFQYPEIQAGYEREIADAARSEGDVSVTDLTGYDEGEFWGHFFWVLDVLSAIYDQAISENRPLLYVWSCS